MTGQPLSLKARALQWLAQREHSRIELRRKLMRLARQRAVLAPLDGAAAADKAPTADVQAPLANPAAEVDALLDWLQAERHLCEQRFVESRINARSARYGNLRIRQELKQHGASLDTDSETMLRDNELARAHAVWLRKFGRGRADDAADATNAMARATARARQMRFLAGRGFSSDVIHRVIRGEVDDSTTAA